MGACAAVLLSLINSLPARPGAPGGLLHALALCQGPFAYQVENSLQGGQRKLKTSTFCIHTPFCLLDLSEALF